MTKKIRLILTTAFALLATAVHANNEMDDKPFEAEETGGLQTSIPQKTRASNPFVVAKPHAKDDRLTLQIFSDNAGETRTGRYRGGMNATLVDPFGWNDKIALSYIRTIPADDDRHAVLARIGFKKSY